MVILAVEDLVVVGVLAFAHLIGAVASFGGALLAVPVLVLLHGPEALPRIVVLVLAVGTIQALVLAWTNRQACDRRVLAPVLGGAVCGLPLGMVIVPWLPKGPLMVALALTILFGAAAQWFLRLDRARQAPLWFGGLIGIGGGLIHGAFGTGGAVLVTYTRLSLPEREAFRATMAATWACLNTVVLSLAMVGGVVQTMNVTLLALSVVAVTAVTYLGNHLAQRLPAHPFAIGVSVLMVLSALTLLVSAVRPQSS